MGGVRERRCRAHVWCSGNSMETGKCCLPVPWFLEAVSSEENSAFHWDTEVEKFVWGKIWSTRNWGSEGSVERADVEAKEVGGRKGAQARAGERMQIWLYLTLQLRKGSPQGHLVHLYSPDHFPSGSPNSCLPFFFYLGTFFFFFFLLWASLMSLSTFVISITSQISWS